MYRFRFFNLLLLISIISLLSFTTQVFAEEGVSTEVSTEVSAEESSNTDINVEVIEEDIITNDDETSEDSEPIEPGLTPDKVLYVFDKLFENIQLALTFDDVKKSELLLSISEERLAEANYLLELADDDSFDNEEWNELFQNVINDYNNTMDEALTSVEEYSCNLSEEDKADLDILVEEITQSININEDLIEQSDELEDTIAKATLVASVVSDLDPEKVDKIRDAGAGYGQISQIFSLSEVTGEDIEEITNLFIEDGMGLGQAAKELGISPSELNNGTKNNKKENTANKNKTQFNYYLENSGEEQNNQAENQVNAVDEDNNEDDLMLTSDIVEDQDVYKDEDTDDEIDENIDDDEINNNSQKNDKNDKNDIDKVNGNSNNSNNNNNNSNSNNSNKLNNSNSKKNK